MERAWRDGVAAGRELPRWSAAAETVPERPGSLPDMDRTAELVAFVEAVADRFRAMPHSRLLRRFEPPGATPARRESPQVAYREAAAEDSASGAISVEGEGERASRSEFPCAGARTRADAGRALAGWLAARACGVEEREAPCPPEAVPVPDVGPFVVGDQLAVTGYDLVTAVSGLGPEEPVWGPGGERTLPQPVIAAAVEQLRCLHFGI